MKMFSYCFFFPLLFISEELAIICSYSDVPEEELKSYFPHIRTLIIEIHCFLFFLLPLNKGMYLGKRLSSVWNDTSTSQE